jgi:SAM-dependent methyltransferase
MEKTVYKEINQIAERHWWFRGRQRIFEHILRSFVPVNDKYENVLDVGCGPGINLGILKKFAKNIYGLDNSQEVADLATKNNYPITFIKGDFPFYEDEAKHIKYNLITLFDVLEHIQEDDRALSKIEDLLLSGGTAIITVPAFKFLWTVHDERCHHYRRYTVPELRKKIGDSTKLKIEKISYFNFLLFLPILIFRKFKKVVGSEQDSDFFMPPIFLNDILARIFAFEGYLLDFINVPLGVSIICVLKKS